MKRLTTQILAMDRRDELISTYRDILCLHATLNQMLKAEFYHLTYNYNNGKNRLKLNIIVVCQFYCLFTFVSIKRIEYQIYEILDEFLVIPSSAVSPGHMPCSSFFFWE